MKLCSFYSTSWFCAVLVLLLSCTSPFITKAPEVQRIHAQAPFSIPYYPLEREQDLDVLMKAIGNAKVVLLGESTHGTQEYYAWRSTISRKLIEEKGFDFIAVEGDWVDSYKVNDFIRGTFKDSTEAAKMLYSFDRWPAWMWGNTEMASFVTWLNHYNQQREQPSKIGFYGLDVYSFWKWTKGFNTSDTNLKRKVNEIAACFEPYQNDALRYADAVSRGTVPCTRITEQLWNWVQKKGNNKGIPGEENLLVEQQAALAFNGERYFRTMATNRPLSWNIRDVHMAQTVNRLFQYHGRDAKAIIWVHNGHAGNARYADMSAAGYSSLGTMLSDLIGSEKLFSIGFGTYKGTVTAAHHWNGVVKKLVVPPAKTGSWEDLLHQLAPKNKLVLSKELMDHPILNKWIEFRSIGAVFPDWAVYGRSVIPKRFNAFIFIDSTTAVQPL